MAEAEFIEETGPEYLYRRREEYTLEDYYALPDDRRAELIDGVLYDMTAPGIPHQIAAYQLVRQLEDYIDSQGGDCLPLISPIDVQLDCDEKTMLQPDVVVVCDRSKCLERRVYGAPDLVMEVLSPSTARRDYSLKLEKYRRAGVREYWIIDLNQKKVIVNDFASQSPPILYGTDEPVPVGIFDGKCLIRFEKVFEKIRDFLG